ncbi:neutral/alkaline non-lysosomal ceramidase N-terminal domain-containing protein [Paenibacillus eucommiae]|uniref:Neutral/alkaline non-lysosomal ceramidase N-terminal domain-containing protein n=1 Tax=Paenibacillus eucommiae TaxID=1355755 RepID=A0ABS4IY07_9BACL|nr:neutral/alkaline non-lysosomal ceramidase N-terminal domain-containing protein [Paenibacillus eucommiae]MBP1992464.1 hypothetical protein [Paenibacillus eucommiae]
MIRCGMHEIQITPALGSSIPGYLSERKGTGVRDELFVKAFVVETADVNAVMVVIDALNLTRKEVQRIRRRIQEETGIAESHIMVSTTHTHTGPPIRPGFDGSDSGPYLDWLVAKAGDAAAIAFRNKREARIGFGTGEENGISYNRRYWMADDTLQTNPGFGNSEIVRPAGPIDSDVQVIRIDDTNGEPIGVITCFACHTDTVGGTEYSADFPGELSRTLKQVLGEQVVSLFLLGACGDINHCNFMKRNPPGEEHYRTMGRILAGEVLKVREKIFLEPSITEPVLAVDRVLFEMEFRSPTHDEVEEAKRILTITPDPQGHYSGPARIDNEHFFARQLLEVLDNPVSSTEIEIQVFRIGECAIVGLPGELFVELGLQIKRESPFSQTMLNTLCNGSTVGYVYTRKAYEEGGYEPRVRNNSRNPVGAGELFAERAVEQLNRMAGKTGQ